MKSGTDPEGIGPPNYNRAMGFDDYKLVIAGCHALMPTAEEVVRELTTVFELIEEEYRANGKSLPLDTTEIVHA